METFGSTGAYQAFANVPLRSFFDSAPEVRALCSTGITRLQRSYGPVRLPVPAAIPSDGVGTMLHRHWVSLSNAVCLPNMPCSLPRRTEPVLVSVASRFVLPSPFPRRVGVHNFAFEACSSFTHVTACRVARPPYGGLCHEASTRSVTRPGRSLATMFTDGYMGGSFPHRQTAPARRTRKFRLTAQSYPVVAVAGVATVVSLPDRDFLSKICECSFFSTRDALCHRRPMSGEPPGEAQAQQNEEYSHPVARRQSRPLKVVATPYRVQLSRVGC